MQTLKHRQHNKQQSYWQHRWNMMVMMLLMTMAIELRECRFDNDEVVSRDVYENDLSITEAVELAQQNRLQNQLQQPRRPHSALGTPHLPPPPLLPHSSVNTGHQPIGGRRQFGTPGIHSSANRFSLNQHHQHQHQQQQQQQQRPSTSNGMNEYYGHSARPSSQLRTSEFPALPQYGRSPDYNKSHATSASFETFEYDSRVADTAEIDMDSMHGTSRGVGDDIFTMGKAFDSTPRGGNLYNQSGHVKFRNQSGSMIMNNNNTNNDSDNVYQPTGVNAATPPNQIHYSRAGKLGDDTPLSWKMSGGRVNRASTIDSASSNLPPMHMTSPQLQPTPIRSHRHTHLQPPSSPLRTERPINANINISSNSNSNSRPGSPSLHSDYYSAPLPGTGSMVDPTELQTNVSITDLDQRRAEAERRVRATTQKTIRVQSRLRPKPPTPPVSNTFGHLSKNTNVSTINTMRNSAQAGSINNNSNSNNNNNNNITSGNGGNGGSNNNKEVGFYDLRKQGELLNKFRHENFDLRLRIFHLEQALDNRSPDGLQDLLSKNEQYRAALRKANDEISRIRDEKNNHIEKIGILEHELQKADDSNIILRDQLIMLEQKLENDNYNTNNTNNNEMKDEIESDARSGELLEAHRELEECRQELAITQAELMRLRERNIETERDATKLTQQNIELKKHLLEWQESHNKIKEEIHLVNQREIHLERERDAFKFEIGRLKSKLNEYNLMEIHSNSNNNRPDSRVSHSSRTSTLSAVPMAAATTPYSTAEPPLSPITAVENEDLNVVSEHGNNNYSNKMAELQAMITTLQAKNQAARESINNKTRHILQLEEQLSSTVRVYQQQILSTERIEEESASYKRQIANLTEACASLEGECSILAKRLNERVEEIESLKDELQIMNHTVEELSKRIATLQRQNTNGELRTLLDERESDIKQLQSDLDIIAAQSKELRKQLDEQKADSEKQKDFERRLLRRAMDRLSMTNLQESDVKAAAKSLEDATRTSPGIRPTVSKSDHINPI
ncbi:hypothetical protein GQ42DRAFT_175868 [Ramicandelaber brevisporus]|nr:hypothetical protein GQ42DRAFT_175868 [Ramicandelaber brevisporus]